MVDLIPQALRQGSRKENLADTIARRKQNLHEEIAFLSDVEALLAYRDSEVAHNAEIDGERPRDIFQAFAEAYGRCRLRPIMSTPQTRAALLRTAMGVLNFRPVSAEELGRKARAAAHLGLIAAGEHERASYGLHYALARLRTRSRQLVHMDLLSFADAVGCRFPSDDAAASVYFYDRELIRQLLDALDPAWRRALAEDVARLTPC
jgi:hypothetical protein